jgi:hypothetical protein
MTFFPLVAIRCFSYNKSKGKFMHSSNLSEHTENNWNSSVTGHKGPPAFDSANYCQGQLQTPHSLSVGVYFIRLSEGGHRSCPSNIALIYMLNAGRWTWFKDWAIPNITEASSIHLVMLSGTSRCVKIQLL